MKKIVVALSIFMIGAGSSYADSWEMKKIPAHNEAVTRSYRDRIPNKPLSFSNTRLRTIEVMEYFPDQYIVANGDMIEVVTTDKKYAISILNLMIDIDSIER